ncbi:aspartate aminotransferase family protein [Bacillus sp. AFS002410]|uniref:(R)-1-hydroxy-2-aminoethylphosphonate ammonia-lyase n=1 Tax=Bacillus sp. AFS002410 TaxID=2033481 RepID=UPI000BF0B25A|nr:aspartate aminotransferase family protein [Bacillus sp. AFS002410]PEJ60609.1 aspartate aminotransferase family protein [Bacillus sp. AFS002410]
MTSKLVSREQGDINSSTNRDTYWNRNLSEKARELFEEDQQYFLHQSLSTPVLNVLSKCDGAYLYDMDGKKYLDLHGNGVHNAGFNNDYVIEKVIDALKEKKTFTPRRYTNEQAINLAKKLVEITPRGLDRVLFAPGGSEAIEMAVMLAKQITGKWKTISFWDSYHGTGFQAASIGGEELFKGGNGPMVPGALHVEFPNYLRNPWNFTNQEDVDNEILRQMTLLFEKEGEIACVIGEPISATPVMPSKNFWLKVKELCNKYGALLIFDEIIEGFGRTGKMFAFEHYVTPDILVLGKTLGGGLFPFAGIMTKEEYNILENRSIGHYTHEKNGICATAGLATIEYIENENLVENANRLGQYLIEELRKMVARYDIVGGVDGIGFHLGIDIVKNKDTMQRGIEEAESIMYMCMENGLAFKLIEGNIITMRPSLILTKEEIDFILGTLEDAIKMVVSGEVYK